MTKHILKSLQWFLRHVFTVFSCVAIIALGMGAVAYSSTSTTIGNNISTGGTLTVLSNSTLATTTISGGDLIVDTDTLFVDNNNNRVGVGTTTPGAKLAVENTVANLSFAVSNQADDSTPFVIDASGNVGIGTANPTEELNIYNNNSMSSDILMRASAYGNFLLGQRSSGTLANPGVPANGVVLLALAGGGYNGSNWVDQKGQISIKSNGNWTDTNNPTKITFDTTPEGSITQAERMVINNAGNVGIGTNAPSSLLDMNSTATTTLEIDSSSATQGVCLKLKDSDGVGYSYCTINNGSLTCSTTSCE